MRSRVNALFEKMVGFRFESYEEMEQWFRRQPFSTVPV